MAVYIFIMRINNNFKVRKLYYFILTTNYLLLFIKNKKKHLYKVELLYKIEYY